MRLVVVGVAWPRVEPGDDLAAMIVADLSLDDGSQLTDGDVVVVTSKVVSKAEDRYSEDHDRAVADETRRIVASRGALVITETHHGHVQANAGVDRSNVEPGRSLRLPLDPDGTASRLRTALYRNRGVNAAVLVTDTMGRAWRTGQVDQVIGCAGMLPVLDLSGTVDPYGNGLTATMPAIADEIASAADLVQGKSSNRPVAVVRGLADRVLAPSDDGPGASALVRSATEDLFGWGAREAVVASLRRCGTDLEHFGQPGPGDTERAVAIVLAQASSAVVIAADEGRIDLTTGPDAPSSAVFDCGRTAEQLVAVLASHRRAPSVRRLETGGWRVAYLRHGR